MLGTVTIGASEVFVRDAAQLPAQFVGHADGVERGAFAHDRLNGVDMMRDQVGRHLVEIGRVLDDPARYPGEVSGNQYTVQSSPSMPQSERRRIRSSYDIVFAASSFRQIGRA